jgi:hypothetical protein
MDTSETLPKDTTKNSKTESKPVMTISWRKNGINKHDTKSETERLITRYVPGFLKHFKGSLKMLYSPICACAQRSPLFIYKQFI